MTHTHSTHTPTQPCQQPSRQPSSRQSSQHGSQQGSQSCLWSQPDPSALIDDAGIIPFADEPHPSASPISPMDLEETAHDEFGAHDSPPPRFSAVDQALGLQQLNTSARRTGFSCPCCQHSVSRAMRVRVPGKHPSQSRWVALCAVCAASMLASVPGTIVGGMVRPTRRRRPIRSQASAQSRGISRRNTRYRRAG